MNIFEEQPISNIEWKLAKDLNPNDYNPNRVLTDEFKLLALNIIRFGWIQPILINKNNIIIDGFHRWKLCTDSEVLYKNILEEFLALLWISVTEKLCCLQ